MALSPSPGGPPVLWAGVTFTPKPLVTSRRPSSLAIADDGLLAVALEGHVGHVDGLGRVGVLGHRLALELRLDGQRLRARDVGPAHAGAVGASGVERHLGARDLLAGGVEEREAVAVDPLVQERHAGRQDRALAIGHRRQIVERLAAGRGEVRRLTGRLGLRGWCCRACPSRRNRPPACRPRSARQGTGEVDARRPSLGTTDVMHAPHPTGDEDCDARRALRRARRRGAASSRGRGAGPRRPCARARASGAGRSRRPRSASGLSARIEAMRCASRALSSRAVAVRARLARAKRSQARAKEMKLVRPPQR